MALVTPLLLTLMFGSFELGNYFLDNHVIAKAVRDGARFAARQNFTNYTACGGSPTGTVDTQTKNLVRTGTISSGGNPRLPGWTDANTTISITVSCNTTGNNGGAFTGIYTGMTSAPIVTVTAAVPYTSLFGALGFNAGSLTLNARSQASVMGI
jgi:Flp pilus assembly protein TadG